MKLVGLENCIWHLLKNMLLPCNFHEQRCKQKKSAISRLIIGESAGTLGIFRNQASFKHNLADGKRGCQH
jgi:hypothetical protein